MADSIPMPSSQPSTPKASTQVPTDQPQKEKFAGEVIDLPSEGFFYPQESPLASGRIEIKYMTAKEEDILSSQNLIKKGIVLDELLKALILTEGVKLDDLLLTDKNAVFVAARRLAYGDNYKATKITCPSCGQDSEMDINLSEIKTKPFDFSKYQRGVNVFEFVLPASKKTITYKLLTNGNNKDIETEIQKVEKIFKTGTALPEITTRLKYMILSVDGNTDVGAIRKFVDGMLSRDSMALRKHIRENTPELDMTVEFKCPHCGHTERIALPLGVDFFWPST